MSRTSLLSEAGCLREAKGHTPRRQKNVEQTVTPISYCSSIRMGGVVCFRIFGLAYGCCGKTGGMP
jgi:hypothetical protein